MAARVTPLMTPTLSIILVEPQIAQNIGKTARAMMNFNVHDLRLVRPQANCLSKDARALAAGADAILENAKIFETTEAAIADLHRIYATTARHRDMVGLHCTPSQAGQLIATHHKEGQSVGVLFGPERAGLTNEDVALSDGTISVPLNPEFSSLNLAQAVLLIVYESFQAGHETPPLHLKYGEGPMATREELLGFLNHLEDELQKAGYFRTAHKKPRMLRTIHTMFSRVAYSAQEVRTLRGIVSDLVNPNGIYSKRKPRQKD